MKINFGKLLEVYGNYRAKAYKEFSEKERKEFFDYLENKYDEILLDNKIIEKKFNEMKSAS